MEPSREPHWEQQAVGLQYRSNTNPGDQAGEKPHRQHSPREGGPRAELKQRPRPWAGCGAQLGLLRAIKAH